MPNSQPSDTSIDVDPSMIDHHELRMFIIYELRAPSDFPGLERRDAQHRAFQRQTQNVPVLQVSGSGQTPGNLPELTEDELMLAPPTVYGFSLADKMWREYFQDPTRIRLMRCSRIQRR